jgi:hypothetical protein
VSLLGIYLLLLNTFLLNKLSNQVIRYNESSCFRRSRLKVTSRGEGHEGSKFPLFHKINDSTVQVENKFQYFHVTQKQKGTFNLNHFKTHQYRVIHKSGCATTKTDTAETSISIGRESLQVFFFFVY